MNQAVRKTRKTNWSPPGWTGPPLNISKIHPRTGLYSEADSFLFNGMTGCYDNANVAALDRSSHRFPCRRGQSGFRRWLYCGRFRDLERGGRRARLGAVNQEVRPVAAIVAVQRRSSQAKA